MLSGTGDDEKWTFRSDLVREVAYSTLTKADRARSHAGIAALDRGARGPRPRRRRRPHHLPLRARRRARQRARAGRRPARATSPSGRSTGSRRRRRAANQAEIPVVAERLYREGLRLLAGVHGPRHRAFLTGRARALAGLRELAPARADAVAAVEESRARPGPTGAADLGRALLVLADIEQKESGWDGVRGRARRGAARCSPSSATRPARPRCCASAASRALFRHEYAAATGLLEQALAALRGARRPARRGLGAPEPGLVRVLPGRAEEAEVRLRKAAATFEEIGDQGGLRWAHGLLAWTRFQQGHAAEAGQMAEAILADDRARRRPLGPRHDARARRVGAALDRAAPLSAHRPAAGGPHAVRRASTTSSGTPGLRRARPRAGAGRPRRRGPRDGRVAGPADRQRRSPSASTSCRSWPA